MTTQRRIEANRRNAKFSTGARTIQGKYAIRDNAMNHGLTARSIVVPEGLAEEFEQLRGELMIELRPDGSDEQQLFFEILRARWNMDRCLWMRSAVPLPYGEQRQYTPLVRRYYLMHERNLDRLLDDYHRRAGIQRIDEIPAAPGGREQMVLSGQYLPNARAWVYRHAGRECGQEEMKAA